MSHWTVEQFAELCAHLEANSSRRAEILAQLGLDEESWKAHRAAWTKLLVDRDTPELVWVFGRAYARALAFCLIPATAEPADPELQDVGSGVEKVLDTAVEEETVIVVAEPLQEDDPDRTSHGAFPSAGPALPFKSTGFAAVPATPHSTPRRTLESADTEPADPTIVLDAVSAPERVLPFLTPNKTGAKK